MISLVTGATGFIGTNLVRRLIDEGHEVRVLSRKVTEVAGVRAYVIDYDKPNLGLTDATFENVDVVYHLAGATRADSAEAFYEANAGRTHRLMDRVLATSARPRFLFVSSQAAAGPSVSAARTESDPPSPVGAYGKSKLAAEHIVQNHSADMPWTIVRPCAVYGPGDSEFLTIFAMAKRRVALYPGNRRSVVSTIFVDDLTAGLIAAATSPASISGTYFLAADTPLAFQEIYRTVAEATGKPLRYELEVPLALVQLGGALGDLFGRLTGRVPLLNSDKVALAEPRYWIVSSESARKDFGFTAPTALRDGLAATYSWYVDRGWL